MHLKVLFAPDKFKGTLGAADAAGAMVRGWLRARPGDEPLVLPVSDGGDGFGELISARLGATPRRCQTVDAAHRPCAAQWWWEPRSHSAIIEAARANGLAQLPPGKYHPFELDTFGLAALFQAAVSEGARRVLVGIGGSATNDAGFGMARALGWAFLNERGRVIERWTEMCSLSQFRFPSVPLDLDEVLVAVDVQNPLLGPTGCARVYGPQKGLREEDLPFAERCLSRLAEVAAREFHFDAAAEPGAGAAGGLGFGLRCFLGARLAPGFGLFASRVGLEALLAEANLVVTGEGAMDASTLMGKGVGELAALCRRAGVPCLGLAGAVADPGQAAGLFHRAYALAPDLTSREEALREPALWLERLAEKAAREWSQT